ncbi:MAG TPA: DUF1353 domain-containing protein [Acidimicrobiales bacterium]
MPFEDGADAVVVQQVDDKNWEVRKDLCYRGNEQRWTVPAGSGTDFASVPRVLVWFLPRYGRYTKAAILHDFLWRHKAVTGEISWVDADGTFRRAMRELGVPFLRRWMMWSAVRWAALFKPGGRTGWLKESWRVVLVSLVALPFVVPPAAVILVTLLVFLLFEAILYVPLKAASLVRSKVTSQPPTKKVNAPTLYLSTS